MYKTHQKNDAQPKPVTISLAHKRIQIIGHGDGGNGDGCRKSHHQRSPGIEIAQQWMKNLGQKNVITPRVFKMCAQFGIRKSTDERHKSADKPQQNNTPTAF